MKNYWQENGKKGRFRIKWVYIPLYIGEKLRYTLPNFFGGVKGGRNGVVGGQVGRGVEGMGEEKRRN